jgi:tRNA(adenine34) deaminase
MAGRGGPSDPHFTGPDADAADAARHERFMRVALEEARQGLHIGEVPVGAVAVLDQEVLATGFNQPIHNVDPTAHAEVVALRRAARSLGNYRLTGVTLYVTLEPCLMCVGALVLARISTLVYGASEPKTGAVRSSFRVEDVPTNHRFRIVSGILEEDCRKLLVDFFQYRRDEA